MTGKGKKASWTLLSSGKQSLAPRSHSPCVIVTSDDCVPLRAVLSPQSTWVTALVLLVCVWRCPFLFLTHHLLFFPLMLLAYFRLLLSIPLFFLFSYCHVIQCVSPLLWPQSFSLLKSKLTSSLFSTEASTLLSISGHIVHAAFFVTSNCLFFPSSIMCQCMCVCEQRNVSSWDCCTRHFATRRTVHHAIGGAINRVIVDNCGNRRCLCAVTEPRVIVKERERKKKRERERERDHSPPATGESEELASPSSLFCPPLASSSFSVCE